MSKQPVPPIVRPDKKYFLSFSKRQIVIFVLVFGILGSGAILYKTLLTRGANYGWLQTDWSGGASTTAVARHPGDIDTWTKYSSKDALLSTSTDGQLTLSSQTASTTDTADADFNAGTASNTYVENGAVKLKKPNGVSCTSPRQCQSNACNTNCVVCSGVSYNNHCLHLGSLNQSCTTVCSSYGGIFEIYTDDTNCNALRQIISCSNCAGLNNGYEPGRMHIFSTLLCVYSTGNSDANNSDANVERLCACNY